MSTTLLERVRALPKPSPCTAPVPPDPDPVYVHGYRIGHEVMQSGSPRPTTSTAAWVEFRRDCEQVAAAGMGVVRGLAPVTTAMADDVLRDPSPH